MAITVARNDIKRRLQLPAGTVSCTMANSGDTVTALLHGLAVGDVIEFTGTTGGVTASTPYWVSGVTNPDVFQFSATRGGGAFAITGDGANAYSVRTAYDADLDSMITEIKEGLEATLDSTAKSTYEAACEYGIIEVIAGEFLNALRRVPGWAEAVTAGGVAVGGVPESGDPLIARGLAVLAPFTVNGYAGGLAVKSEDALKKALAEARDDHAVTMAAAENAKAVADADLVEAQALVEAAKVAKVTADTGMSTAAAADYQGRADLNAQRLARMVIEDASLAADVALGSSDPSGGVFDIDADEYAVHGADAGAYDSDS
jgi:hypothetical protein